MPLLDHKELLANRLQCKRWVSHLVLSCLYLVNSPEKGWAPQEQGLFRTEEGGRVENQKRNLVYG
jgi:hypothetical protein